MATALPTHHTDVQCYWLLATSMRWPNVASCIKVKTFQLTNDYIFQVFKSLRYGTAGRWEDPK